MNQLQKIELEMLKAFIDVCDKLNLKYYLVCGTALGAVKYNGFIPWDDDIDVGLIREEYEVFCKHAQKLLPQELFLQTHETDPCYPHIFAKLRNSNTTYIEKNTEHISINHGVYIDIFPLDGYPKDSREIEVFEKRKMLYQRRLVCAFPPPDGINNKIRYYVKRVLGYHLNRQKIISEYTKLLTNFPVCDSDYICNHGNWQGHLEYAPAEQYGVGAVMNFEGIKVRVPALYDEYLTQKYGDWRADIPQEQKVGHHHYKILDLNKSYTYYINQ